MNDFWILLVPFKSQAIPTIAVFLASGLFHELLLLINFGHTTGEQLLFFLIHAIALLGQKVHMIEMGGGCHVASQPTTAAVMDLNATGGNTPHMDGPERHPKERSRNASKRTGPAPTRPAPSSSKRPPPWLALLGRQASRAASTLLFGSFLALTLTIFFAPWFRSVALKKKVSLYYSNLDGISRWDFSFQT